jgi:hypothetical protein
MFRLKITNNTKIVSASIVLTAILISSAAVSIKNKSGIDAVLLSNTTLVKPSFTNYPNIKVMLPEVNTDDFISCVFESCTEPQVLNVKINNETKAIKFLDLDMKNLDSNLKLEVLTYINSILKEGNTLYLQNNLINTDISPNINTSAYFWLEIPNSSTEKELQGKMLNSKLILNGYANFIEDSSPTKYSKYFSAFQLEAKLSSKGIWLNHK